MATLIVADVFKFLKNGFLLTFAVEIPLNEEVFFLSWCQDVVVFHYLTKPGKRDKWVDNTFPLLILNYKFSFFATLRQITDPGDEKESGGTVIPKRFFVI